jgi:hypothetical protein
VAIFGRVAAALFALSWALFPGFGLIDLSVTVKPSGEWRPVVPLEAGWGLTMTVMIASAFAWTAMRPRRLAAAVVQLIVLAGVLAVAGVASSEWATLWLSVALLAEVGLVIGTLPKAEPLRPRSFGLSWPLATMAVVSAGPWLLYAVDMYGANREGRTPSDITIGINHWAVQGGLAFGLVALAGIIAVWPRGRRYIGPNVAVVAVYLGACSLRFPDASGAYGREWSVLSVIWGVVVAVLVFLPMPQKASAAGYPETPTERAR